MTEVVSELPHIAVVVVGHVDSGKSTTTGQLLYCLGGVDEREMKKAEALASESGKTSFRFAFLCDKSDEERARGVTIICTARQFFTKRFAYTVIDAPGHKDFIKNMITGAGQADVSIIMLPADGNFGAAIQRGNPKQGHIEGQTRQHSRLLCLLGCKQIICCINKMDTCDYIEERYKECRAEFTNMLIKTGWKKQFVEQSAPFLPISGLHSENMVTKSDKMAWWKGDKLIDIEGNEKHISTLLEALNDFVCHPPRSFEAPMRCPVSARIKIKGVGDVITGRIEQGILQVGREVVFLPTHTESSPCVGKVFSIEMHHKKQKEGAHGDNVGVNIKNLPKDNMPRSGDVMVYKGDTTIGTCKRFTSMVQVLDIPNEIKPNYSPICFVRCARSSCKLIDIKWKRSKETGNKNLENPVSLKSNECALCTWEPVQPIVVDTFDRCEGLGRVAVLDGNNCVMVSRVMSVDFK